MFNPIIVRSLIALFVVAVDRMGGVQSLIALLVAIVDRNVGVRSLIVLFVATAWCAIIDRIVLWRSLIACHILAGNTGQAN